MNIDEAKARRDAARAALEEAIRFDKPLEAVRPLLDAFAAAERELALNEAENERKELGRERDDLAGKVLRAGLMMGEQEERIAELEAKLAARVEPLTDAEAAEVHDEWLHTEHEDGDTFRSLFRMAAEAQRKKIGGT